MHDVTTPTSRRLVTYAVGLGMVVTGLLLLLAVLYFARGSLEEFPTAEQQDKVRTVTGAAALLLAGLEVALWRLLRHVRRASS
jgi:hypothetical protein